MKILLVAPANSVHVVKWANSLVEGGNEVFLAFLQNHKPGMDTIDKRVVLHCLKISGEKGYYLNVLELKDYVKKIKPDIINAHYASGYGTLARLAAIHPLLLSAWGSDIYDFPFKNKINRRIVQNNLKGADYIASTSNCMAKMIDKVGLVEAKEIFITPFGVDLDCFNPSKYELKKDDNIVIGTVKSLEKVYGIDRLIAAFEKLLELTNGTEYEGRLQLKIYGNGSKESELREYIKQNQLEEVVHLMGKIAHDDVPKAISEMDLFCIFSERESFGVSIIEAMSMKKPVCISKTEGFLEITEGGKLGVVIDRENEEKTAETIFDLIKNRDTMIKLGELGRLKVEKDYEWKECVNNMISVYNYIAKQQKNN